MITGAAKIAGVVGWPVAHSLSPLIHNAWIEALGLDAVYIPFAVAPDAFDSFLDGLRGTNVCGLNVTLPHKLRAHDLADELGVAAMTSRAANTLVFRPDRTIHADNTDGDGLRWALMQGHERNWKAQQRPVVLLGAGGAARGAIDALAERGASEVRVVARRLAAAEQLAAGWNGFVTAHDFDRLNVACEGAAAVVNATSAGLNGLGDLPEISAAPNDAVFMDMVYRPLKTSFLRRAVAHGHPTVDGLEMLIGQAAQSFFAFFGVFPPQHVDVRTLCLRALGEA